MAGLITLEPSLIAHALKQGPRQKRRVGPLCLRDTHSLIAAIRLKENTYESTSEAVVMKPRKWALILTPCLPSRRDCDGSPKRCCDASVGG
jgi:hypothetical protein